MRRSSTYAWLSAPLLLVLAASLCLGGPSAALATTYYVDSVGGNDDWDGLSPSTPWQSLGKVNGTTFSPGDEILLKAGSVWQGGDGLLYPKGSGADGSPILIDMYGTGPKPLVNADKTYNLVMGDENVSASVFLYNQEYWEISNLDVMNGQSGGEKQNDTHGVYITAEETGQVHDHIYLLDLDIHDVNARVGRGTGRDKGKNNGGICFDVFGDGVAGTKFNDILVEGCYIYNCGATGIKTWSDQHNWRCHDPTTYGTNFAFRNNVLDHIDGDGICAAMTEDTLIEYNVASWTHMKLGDPYVAIWNYESYDTVMQYNEAYNTQDTTDGQGFDIDDYTLRTIVQYNYSHDNVGGFMLIICIPSERGKCATCDNNVVRYNISQDDGEEIVKFAGEPHHTDFYNNVFYHSGDPSAPPYTKVFRLSKSFYTHAYNNIFETWGGGDWLQPDFENDPDFRRNIIYGNADYSKWVSVYPDNLWGVDPKFQNPGTGGIGRDTCGGYMLQAGSPAIDYGIWSDDPVLMALPDHPGPIGADHGTQDYFGNSLPYPSGTPDSGAHETSGGPQPPVADFSGNPTEGEAPLTVYFTDLSTGNPTSWDWTFGDGGSSQTQNPSHDYTAADNYTVSLEACNSAGCDTETKTNYISVTEPQPPVADFVGDPLSGNAPLNVDFTDLSTNDPTSWDWSFGDGGSSQAQNPSHEYAAGIFTVSLTAANQYGQDTEIKTDYISVSEGQAPVADFVGDPLSGNAPLNVDFTDLSTNDPTSWDWSFGDSGTSQQQNPSHQYTGEGQYNVSLTAANAYGQDTETKNNYITVTTGGENDYFPDTYTIEVGTYVSGGLSDLAASDDSYLVVDSAKYTGKQSTFVIYTFETGLSGLSSLTITSESHPSLAPQRERIRVWDYSSGSWSGVIGDQWLNSTSDQTTVTPIPDPANYISGSGQVQIRIRTGDDGNTEWTHSIDLVKITAAP